MRRYFHISAVLVLFTVGVVFADESENLVRQREELERIQKDVEAGQKRLDSLQNAERHVLEEISGYDDKISSDRRVIGRLSRELDQVKADIRKGDSLLAYHRELLDRRHRRYLGNVRQLYAVAGTSRPVVSDHPNEELERIEKIIYLTALADFESASVADASQLVDQSLVQLDDMSGRQKMITGLRKERETSYAVGRSQKERREQNLDRLRRKSMEEADRIIMLRQAAREMSDLVARLEADRMRAVDRGEAPAGPSAFAALEGQLLTPFRGTVTEGFGEHVDPVTKLKSFSPGITIGGRADMAVYSVSSGSVAYTGNLRGYGNFVIINHDHQYYTTYAGLGEVLVSEGQFLQSRTKLGTAGKDGVIKFELRNGREPLDPVKWIDIESL
jgi:septal ring factor EnvC (AmiA/AmiB activator)